MYRSGSYDHMLSGKMKNRRFAQGYLLTLIEAGFSAEDALKLAIARMGVKEFSEIAHVPRPNVQEFLKGKRKLKPETMDTYLKPFALKTRITLDKAS